MLSADTKFGTIWVKTVGVVPEQTNKQTHRHRRYIYIDSLYSIFTNVNEQGKKFGASILSHRVPKIDFDDIK